MLEEKLLNTDFVSKLSTKLIFEPANNLLCIKADIFSKVCGNLLTMDSVWSAIIGINKYITEVKSKKIIIYINIIDTTRFIPNLLKNFWAALIPEASIRENRTIRNRSNIFDAKKNRPIAIPARKKVPGFIDIDMCLCSISIIVSQVSNNHLFYYSTRRVITCFLTNICGVSLNIYRFFCYIFVNSNNSRPN